MARRRSEAATVDRPGGTDDLIEAIEANNFEALSISPPHAPAAGALPAHHADSFDRMPIAQARTGGLMVVTVDGRFSDYDAELLPVT